MSALYRNLSASALAFCLVLLPARHQAQILPIPGIDTNSNKKDTADKPAPPKALVLQTDSSLFNIMQRLEALTLTLNKDIGILRRGFDTVEISRELPLMEYILNMVSNNLENTKVGLNLRNLYSSQVALQQIDKQVTGYQETLIGYSTNLAAIKNDIEKIEELPVYHNEGEDSMVISGMQNQMRPVLVKKGIADSLHKITIRKLGQLQNRVTSAYLSCADMLDDVNSRIRSYQSKFFLTDQPYIWEATSETGEKTLNVLMQDGFRRNWRVINFYLTLNWVPFVVLLLGAVLFYWLSKLSLGRLKKNGLQGWEVLLHYIRRSPAGAGALLLFTLSPFLLRNPPAGIVQSIWLLMMVTVTAMRWKDWNTKFRRYWFGVAFIFLLYGLDNFLLESSYTERIILLVMNVCAAVLAYFMYWEVYKDKGRYHKLMDESIILFFVINILAFIMNVSGRFTLAKILSNSSALSIVLLLSLQIVKEIILEFIYLLIESNKNSRFYSYLEFNKIKESFKSILGVATFIIWILAFAWSMNFYDIILNGSMEFLKKTRSLGEISFTFSSILIFIILIWISMLVARILAFVFRDYKSDSSDSAKHKGGSWILILRLAIYTTGFLIAIGAAGIPLDKMTIVIGALGVGIGFGLQTIVNNLISGIILAFEQPIQVGDIIDIGTRTGVVKEIGIRSSKIATFEGSDVIVPNGDLLSQQLVNWTHDNSHKRIEIFVGVAYGSDLDKVRQLIESAIQNREALLPDPAPAIFVHEFANSAVSFRILFWAKQNGEAIKLKSDVLASIYKNFGENDIQIPFPQTDLHIKSIDVLAAESIESLKSLAGSKVAARKEGEESKTEKGDKPLET